MKFNEPNILKVRLHKVTVNKDVPHVKVLLTGDWHVSPIVSHQQFDFLKEALNVSKPDVIILQGDLVDSPIELRRETSLKKLIRELRLCAETAPTVLVLGSHDYITPTRVPKIMKKTAIPLWQKICQKCGVKLLLDKWVEFPGIRIFGAFQDERCILYTDKNGNLEHFDDPDGFLACLEENQELIDQKLAQNFDGVTWLASHAPLINDEVIKKLKPFDFASFGHTHGGIVPLGMDEILDKFDLHFGLISPNRRPFPTRVRGATPLSDSTMLIVNPGMIATHFCVSKFLQNLNFIKAAEISVVEIESAAKQPTQEDAKIVKTKVKKLDNSQNDSNNLSEYF